MPTPATLDIQVPRNGDYFEEWQLRDIDGNPIDLTGHTLSAQARPTGGDSTVIANAIIAITEAANGQFTFRWRGSDFDGFGNRFALAVAAYDIKHIHPDGIVNIPVRGQLLIPPEVTP